MRDPDFTAAGDRVHYPVPLPSVMGSATSYDPFLLVNIRSGESGVFLVRVSSGIS